ncbi:RF-1 domain-containing protein 1 [Elsinoe fawcettii]|nr:RF-1 domain-containing protein 1 [Elsinoe fawcettii]
MLTLWRRPFAPALISRGIRASSTQSGGTSEDDIKQARAWLERFNSDTLPRNIFDFSFSRSSGPGGQNVNKVNSKATLKVSLSSLQPLIPRVLWASIAYSRYAATNELIIQTDDSRKQQENVDRCIVKLNELIIQAGKENVPGETSAAQKSRVKNLQRSANEGRLKAKKFKSDKKSARRSGGKPDY